MKNKFKVSSLFLILVSSSASAQSLYKIGNEQEEPLPLKWIVGANLIYDDNAVPGGPVKDSSFAINPYVGVSYVTNDPQTTLSVGARLGLIYYFDRSAAFGGDDIESQSRVTVFFERNVSERLRFTSSSYVAYELEPDYSYGYATSRQLGAYFTWQTDNSIGYRWSERFATSTGIRLTGTNYSDSPNNDRFAYELYNQFRYQLDPQTVLTSEYRIAQTVASGAASDSQDQFLTVGVERLFSATTSGVVSAGAQFRDVDDGDSQVSPFFQLALNSQLTEAFSVRAFTRYSMETYDTILLHPNPAIGLVEFDDRRTLRVGISADYVISPTLSLFSGIDYIPASFQEGRSVSTPPFTGAIADVDDDLFNAYIGVSVEFNDFITGTLSYNYTDSSSDSIGRDYTRNRVSVGVSAAF